MGEWGNTIPANLEVLQNPLNPFNVNIGISKAGTHNLERLVHANVLMDHIASAPTPALIDTHAGVSAAPQLWKVAPSCSHSIKSSHLVLCIQNMIMHHV